MVDKSCLKSLHFAAYFTAFLGCIVAAATVSNLVRVLEGNCPIYADINVTLVRVSANDSTLKIVVRDSSNFEGDGWGSPSSCNFCIYTNVLGAVYAFIFLYFVILMEKGNPDKHDETDLDSLLKDEKVVHHQQHQCSLVIPSMILCTVFTCTMSAVSVEIQYGLKYFCQSLEKGTMSKCSDLALVPWVNFPNGEEFYYLLLAAQIGTWVGMAGYIISLLLYSSSCCGFQQEVVEKPRKKLVKRKVLTGSQKLTLSRQQSLHTATTSVEEISNINS